MGERDAGPTVATILVFLEMLAGNVELRFLRFWPLRPVVGYTICKITSVVTTINLRVYMFTPVLIKMLLVKRPTIGRLAQLGSYFSLSRMSALVITIIVSTAFLPTENIPTVDRVLGSYVNSASAQEINHVVEVKPEQAASTFRQLYLSAVELAKDSRNRIYSYADNTYGIIEIRVDGAASFSAVELESLIPSGKSYYWWKANQDLVIADLRQHPVIKNVLIDECQSKGSSWRCFDIKIKERIPTLWVKAELEKNSEIRFLIADDGAVLSVLSADQQIVAASKFDRKLLARYLAANLTSLPVFDARNLANISDAAEQLFKRAVQLVSIIEEEAGYKVYELRFLSGNDVEVEFESQPFTVVFNVNLDSSINSRIAVQLQRLERILNEKPLLASRAVSINLGLDREAFAVLAKG